MSRNTMRIAFLRQRELVGCYRNWQLTGIKRMFQEIKHTHNNRPDLDYDDTKVGPAEGVKYVSDDGKKDGQK